MLSSPPPCPSALSVLLRLALTGIVLLLPAPAGAEVRINEFVSENLPPANWPGAPVDLDGDSPDWMELYNPDAAVALGGWALSDDPALLNKWTFPATTLNAGGYLTVYASGKNRATSGVQLHTNFKLGRNGSLLLSKPDGAGGFTVVSQLGTPDAPCPPQRFLASYGVVATAPVLTYGYLTTITPAAANAAAGAVSEFCQDTRFSVDRGFYDAPFSTVITCATPGASLIYTFNGSEPTATNGTKVLPPDAATPPTVTIPISNTTLLRARAIKSGLGSSDVDTQSYLFPAGILTQTGPPASLGLTAAQTLAWSHFGTADWAMDPTVVNSADPANQCRADDLKAIPAVSVVMDWKGLFGPNDAGKTNGGIYPPAPGVAEEGVDRVASLELLNPAASSAAPNAQAGFQEDGNIHIFGGSSQSRWRSDKLSMRFQANSNISTNVLGDDAAGTYNNLILDARFNLSWAYGGGLEPENQHKWADYVRDQVVSDLQNGMGGYSVHTRNVHLFLNGIYWGIYAMHEKPDHHFQEAYQGGDSAGWDVVKHHPSEAGFIVNSSYVNPAQSAYTKSNSTAYTNYESLLDLCGVGLDVPNPVVDTNTATAYNNVAAKLDVEDFIKYMLLNFYAGNTDWAGHNWYASYQRASAAGKWRFHAWDSEHVFKDAAENTAVTRNDPGGPTSIHQKLRTNTEYKLRFADITHRYFFNGGLFTTAPVQAFFDARLQGLDQAIRGESARWGDNRYSGGTETASNMRYWRSGIPGTTPATVVNGLTRPISWLAERERLRATVLPGRNPAVLAALKSQGLYPTLSAPGFSQHGGTVPANYALTITNPNAGAAPGTIHYSTDGSDPRLPGTPGTVRPGALTYTAGTPVLLAGSGTVKARVFTGSVWSALNEAYFSVATEPASAANLIVSKIHYRPKAAGPAEIAAGFTDRDQFEFLELMNIGTAPVDLSGVTFGAGLDYTFGEASLRREIPPGGRILLVRDRAAFEFRYGTGHPVAGEFSNGTGLSNSGERLEILAKNAATIKNFTYNNKAPWPLPPDGGGPSLVLVRPATNPDHTAAFNWRASRTPDGSPGQDERLTYANWVTASFPSENAGDPQFTGPDRDPDADGLSNALEFAFAQPPMLAGGFDAFPTLTMTDIPVGGITQRYPVFGFRCRPAAEEVRLFPWISTDLTNWSGTSADLVYLGAQDHADGTATLTWRTPEPLTAGQRRFFRAGPPAP